MKLRIKGDSVRLRVSPSEVARLLQGIRIEEAVHFAPDATLVYSLEPSSAEEISARYTGGEIAILVPASKIHDWGRGSEVGIYAQTGTHASPLEVVIEKDFACLDKSEEENQDTFPHPKQGAAC